jgi:hypothetical protein
MGDADTRAISSVHALETTAYDVPKGKQKATKVSRNVRSIEIVAPISLD